MKVRKSKFPKTVDEFLKLCKPRKHTRNDFECWCNPMPVQMCRERDPDTMAMCKPSCWKCHGEGIEAEYDPASLSVIVHRLV